MTVKKLYELLELIPDLPNDDIVKLTRYAFFNPIVDDLNNLQAPAGSEAQRIFELIEKDDYIRYFFQIYMKMKYIYPFQPSLEWCFDLDSEDSSWDYLKTRLIPYLDGQQIKK